jgi:hypothetical protein
MPFVEGTTRKGWGVVRQAPWHLAGVFSTKVEADQERTKLGKDYMIRFGENQVGTDNFVSSSSEDPDANGP